MRALSLSTLKFMFSILIISLLLKSNDVNSNLNDLILNLINFISNSIDFLIKFVLNFDIFK